jgi:hypothetical protein
VNIVKTSYVHKHVKMKPMTLYNRKENNASEIGKRNFIEEADK